MLMRRMMRGKDSLRRRDIVAKSSVGAVAIAAVAALAVLGGASTRASAAGSPVVVAGWGGLSAKAEREFGNKFSKQTGIPTKYIEANGEFVPRLDAMRKAGKITWDVLSTIAAYDAPVLQTKGYLAPLPAKLRAKFKSLGMNTTEFGFTWAATGHIVTCNMDVVTKCPRTIKEFFDVKGFPGDRAIYPSAPEIPLTMAAVAAGVPKAKLFPLNLKKAFAQMRKIKPSVKVWFTSGDQSQQILRDGEVGICLCWSGRAYTLKGENSTNLRINWAGIYEPGYWAVLKDAKNKEGGFKLLEWIATHPREQAEYAQKIHYSVASPQAFKYMDKATAESLADNPRNFPKLVQVDWNWFANNGDRVRSMWKDFITK